MEIMEIMKTSLRQPSIPMAWLDYTTEEETRPPSVCSVDVLCAYRPILTIRTMNSKSLNLSEHYR